ncbi:methylmalonyl-CoA mutase, C-terminal domain [Haloechinothrix alba]|uniref:Methylmalonyl-CoA mutase, C-terminal domain n=1 Tax=Haloechinothrix alba TaxID=664784 RepID=A0A239A754_9PSEU|nr:cobalamin-dependent protein [Haloechinothrix alba]SNR90894.1 methylmalonyl-CoA mutase, C-terminal domain [Haloechinothrix alba]
MRSASGSDIRCVLGMLGVDVHSKGLRTLARLLRDRGVTIVYLGEHNSPDGMAHAVAVEDADVVGVSFSTSTYVPHTTALLAAMRRAGVADVPLMVGGLIHPDDEPTLLNAGVAAVFGPSSTTEEIMNFLTDLPRARDRAAS